MDDRSISFWQDRYEHWARDKGLFICDNEPSHFMKLSEELGEVAEKLIDAVSPEEISSEIGDVVATLLILVEQWNWADMRIILANSVGVKGYSLDDSNFDDYQSAILRREEAEFGNLTNDRLMLLTQLHVGKLSKAITLKDNVQFFACVSKIMENQSLLVSKLGLSLQETVASNYEKIRNRTGKTVNGIFVKDK